MTAPQRFYLTKRNNGVYYVAFFEDGRKRWKSTRCRTKADAVRAVSKLQELFKKRTAPKPLLQFVEAFLEHSRAVYAPKTVELYDRALKNLLSSAGDVMLSELSPQHIDRYKAERLLRASPTTTNMELRALKAAMETAVRWRFLEKNPFATMEQARKADTPPTYLTRADFDRLLACVQEGWLKELVVFAVSTGLRQGEMLNLRWDSVDLQRRLVHVHSHSTFRTKLGRRRTIPMNETAYAILRQKLQNPGGEFVFTRRGQRIRPGYLQHVFKEAVRTAKLDERLHWHSLRHTHASWLVQAGASLYEVQKLLGHSSPSLTEIYSHLSPEGLHDRVNLIQIPVN